MTPAELLIRELRRDGARPLLTWYDDKTGERVELSVATAANWAAKVANLLVDEFDVAAGDDVGVTLPAHWETAMVLLGCWTAGAHVRVGAPAAVAFGLRDAAIELSLAPMGVDFSRLVAAQPDDFVGPPAEADQPALSVAGRTWSHGELGAAAEHAAAHHGVARGDRVLSTLGYDTVDGLDAGLLVPVAAGAAVVLVGHARPERVQERCTAERVTHTAGVDAAGLPRLC